MKNSFLIFILITTALCRHRRTPRKLLEINSQSPKPKKKQRKLLLNWFDSTEEDKNDHNHEESMKKVMELLEMANSFKDNDNIDVGVDISFKGVNVDTKHEEENKKI